MDAIDEALDYLMNLDAKGAHRRAEHIATIRAALATLRDAAKDARRYRWLRDGLEANATDAYEIAEFGYRGGVDAAIDAAMGEQP